MKREHFISWGDYTVINANVRNCKISSLAENDIDWHDAISYPMIYISEFNSIVIYMSYVPLIIFIQKSRQHKFQKYPLFLSATVHNNIL